MAAHVESREHGMPGEGWRLSSLLSASLLAGSLVTNSLDLLTTWHICSLGGKELNVIMASILSEYGFTALAVYKGWMVSGLLVLLYLGSTRDWRWRGLAVLILASVTILLVGVVAWNGMQILKVAGIQL